MSVLTPKTRLEIVNAALLRLGQPRITSFSDTSAEAEVVKGLYYIAKERALSTYFWKFATRQLEIAETINEDPDLLVDYDHVYNEPPNCIRIVNVRGNTRYERAQGQIYTNQTPPIVVEYIEDVDESSFPPHFVHAFVLELSYQFCMALSEDTSRTAMFERQAFAAWREARHIEATTQPTKSFHAAINSSIRRHPSVRP